MLEASQGRIVIDGIEIGKLDLMTLRSRITLIPQEPILFEDTLKVNLDPTRSKADEELWTILDTLKLGDKFRKMNGLETKIIESGENLSSGEK